MSIKISALPVGTAALTDIFPVTQADLTTRRITAADILGLITGYATTELDNLGTTAINANLNFTGVTTAIVQNDVAFQGIFGSARDLLKVNSVGRVEIGYTTDIILNGSTRPDLNNTRTLGVVGLAWSEVVANNFDLNNAGVFAQSLTLPSGQTGVVGIRADGAASQAAIFTENEGTADAVQTGNVWLQTGNKTAGTGNSGNIYLQTGTSAGGSRGTVNFIEGSLTSASVGDVWTLQNLTTGEGAWGDLSSSVDHGLTSGLGDDDHTQYLLADSSRDFTNILTGPRINLTGVSGVIVQYNGVDYIRRGSNGSNDFIAAGNSTTTGSANAAIGGASLGSLTTGSFNFASGTSSLFFVNTGSSNTAVGSLSQFNLTTGTANTTLGNRSGTGILTASSTNIANGDNALGNFFNLGSQSNNIAFGANSIFTVQGDYNVALGDHAGEALTTADNNVFIGRDAGNNQTGGDSNIIIGYDSQTPALTTANQLVIGNLIYGTALDGRDTTISSGNIGIAVKTPNEKLQIDGNLHLTDDDQTVILGAGKDATLSYDGTDLKIDPKVVGSGKTVNEGILKNEEAIELAIEEVSANTTLDGTHYTLLVDASGANRTITLPAAASTTDRIYNIKKIDSSSNTVTVDGNASETIDGSTTFVLNSQYDSVMIQCDGTEWWII